MVAVPAATPVTRPELLTVAIDVFDELQVTFLLVAFDGETVAVSCCVVPTLTEADVGLTVTPVTEMVPDDTVPEIVISLMENQSLALELLPVILIRTLFPVAVILLVQTPEVMAVEPLHTTAPLTLISMG